MAGPASGSIQSIECPSLAQLFGHRSSKNGEKSETTITASKWQEAEWYVAQCMQVDVASKPATEDEALDNLRNACGYCGLEESEAGS